MNLLLQQPGRTPAEEIVRKAVIDEAYRRHPTGFDMGQGYVDFPTHVPMEIAEDVAKRTGIYPRPRAVGRAIEGYHVWRWVILDGPKKGKVRKEPLDG